MRERVCMCCVYERERERERQTDREGDTHSSSYEEALSWGIQHRGLEGRQQLRESEDAGKNERREMESERVCERERGTEDRVGYIYTERERTYSQRAVLYSCSLFEENHSTSRRPIR